jgi:hypothetical protein
MIYLGRYGSPESRERYDQVIAEWMASGRVVAPSSSHRGLSVNEVLLAYRRHAGETYVDENGQPTPELERINLAFRPVMQL